MVFKTLVIVAACVILSMADDMKHTEGDVTADDVKPLQDGDTAVAEVEHNPRDDLQTGDEDLKSDGSAFLAAYAPYGPGPVDYGHVYAAQVPFPGFYGKPYAYGYHHGYHHELPFFGYGGFGHGGYGHGYGGGYGGGYGFY